MLKKIFKKKGKVKQEKIVYPENWTKYISNEEWATAEENPSFYVELEKIGKQRYEEQKERLR